MPRTMTRRDEDYAGEPTARFGLNTACRVDGEIEADLLAVAKKVNHPGLFKSIEDTDDKCHGIRVPKAKAEETQRELEARGFTITVEP